LILSLATRKILNITGNFSYGPFSLRKHSRPMVENFRK
jgi:hypothetical protein